MSNWITNLKEESARKDREIAQLRQGLNDILGYLNLPKFHEDTTVQISDIILRIQEIKMNSNGEEA